jgi:hypothetical protein
MTRRLFRLLALPFVMLGACDEPAQPRPPQPDAAIDGGAAGSAGTSGAGGGGAGGAGGRSGSGGSCEAASPPLAPPAGPLPPATAGAQYTQAFVLTGATASQVTWSTRGTLPAGVQLVEDERELNSPAPEARATLTGMPTAPGMFQFTVIAGLPPASCSSAPSERDYSLIVEGGDTDAGSE